MRLAAILLLSSVFVANCAAGDRKIVLIAGPKSHGPGAHEYVKSIKLIKVMLDQSPNVKGIRTELVFNGWPTDPAVLEDADTIVTLSDGPDGINFEAPLPFLATPERVKTMERLMARGCGFMTFHFSTFVYKANADRILEWGGGYFDWQVPAGQKWYSAIKITSSDMLLGTPDHPISRGVHPFRYTDEFYYHLRFRPNDPRWRPILLASALGGSPLDQTVAWAIQRADGGRGFGTSTGHFFANWQNDDYRKLILNAIVWTSGADVPEGGVISSYVDEQEVDRALMTKPY
jgi:type 1 glutamine amidotransferase